MTDERYDALLNELNAKQKELSLAWTFGLLNSFITIILMAYGGVTGFIIGIILLAVAIILGIRIDSSRRSVVVMYNLESDAAEAYKALTEAFDQLAASARKWRIDAGGAVRDIHTWKRNAGASTLVDRRPTEFGYALPRVLKANITPPFMKVGKETLYWLPDVLLVIERDKVGAVPYDILEIAWQDSRFVEEEFLPGDALVIGQTWKHPNKNGGPDRRFANNRQIPVCLYESIYLRSANGLNELLQVSSTGRTKRLHDAAKRLAKTIGFHDKAQLLPKI